MSLSYMGIPKYRSNRREEQKHEIGFVTGLAWTEVGGEILATEATLMEGKGQLTLTGKLGDVMQESAQAAFSYVRFAGSDVLEYRRIFTEGSTYTFTFRRARYRKTVLPPESRWQHH